MQRSLARQFLHDMSLARLFEQVAAEQYVQGRIGGFLHLYPGEEAVAVGGLRAADVPAPYNAQLEQQSIPTPDVIVAEIRCMLGVKSSAGQCIDALSS